MTGGGPVRATMVPALHMYYQAFRFSRFGYGAAIGFVLFVVILLATLINLKVLKPAEEL
jgi:raffinose/stachyose/melibiose transport system permease protein